MRACGHACMLSSSMPDSPCLKLELDVRRMCALACVRVCFMHAGFAMLEAGTGRSKNVQAILIAKKLAKTSKIDCKKLKVRNLPNSSKRFRRLPYASERIYECVQTDPNGSEEEHKNFEKLASFVAIISHKMFVFGYL